MKVIKRDSKVVDFQPQKIRKAIEGCCSKVETFHLAHEVEEIVLNELSEQEKKFAQLNPGCEYVTSV